MSNVNSQEVTHRPIDVFVHYDGKRAADVPASRYGLRSVVAKEVRSRHSPDSVSVTVTTAQLEADALRKIDGEEATTTSAKDYMAAYRLWVAVFAFVGAAALIPSHRAAKGATATETEAAV